MKFKENIKQLIFIFLLIISLIPLIYIFIEIDGFTPNNFCPFNTATDQNNFLNCVSSKIDTFEKVL